jgi:hypothetical protein
MPPELLAEIFFFCLLFDEAMLVDPTLIMPLSFFVQSVGSGGALP